MADTALDQCPGLFSSIVVVSDGSGVGSGIVGWIFNGSPLALVSESVVVALLVGVDPLADGSE